MSGYFPVIPLAGAYPSPDLPAAQLAMMIVVPVGLLFVRLTWSTSTRPGGEHRRPPLGPLVPPSRASQAVAAPDAAYAYTAGIEPPAHAARTLVA